MIDAWIQQGGQKEQQKGIVAIMLKQLQRQIGFVDDAAQARLLALPFEQLEQLGVDLLDFNQPDDLAAWLRTHAGKVS